MAAGAVPDATRSAGTNWVTNPQLKFKWGAAGLDPQGVVREAIASVTSVCTAMVDRAWELAKENMRAPLTAEERGDEEALHRRTSDVQDTIVNMAGLVLARLEKDVAAFVQHELPATEVRLQDPALAQLFSAKITLESPQVARLVSDCDADCNLIAAKFQAVMSRTPFWDTLPEAEVRECAGRLSSALSENGHILIDHYLELRFGAGDQANS